MSLIIPEVILQDAVNKILSIVRADFLAVGQESDSLLYKTLNGLRVLNYDMYEQAKTVIMTEPNKDPRHIEVLLSYNPQDVRYPSVHITLPSESTGTGQAGVDSLGFGEGDVDDNPADDATTWNPTFNRSFQAIYNVVILSDNRNEVTLIYHLLKAGLIALNEHLQLSGLNNIMFSGGDLSFKEQVPPGLFLRSISCRFFYDVNVPSWETKDVVKEINISGTVVEE
jgi:hypothetical protein